MGKFILFFWITGAIFLYYFITEIFRSHKIQKWAITVRCKIIGYKQSGPGIVNTAHNMFINDPYSENSRYRTPTVKLFAEVEYIVPYTGQVYRTLDRTSEYSWEQSRPPAGTEYLRKILPEEPREIVIEKFNSAFIFLGISAGTIFTGFILLWVFGF